MVSKASSRIYDAIVGYFGAEGSFTQFICPSESMCRPSLAELGNELSIEYIVPSSVCQSVNGRQQLSVSATLALLDEFSTYGLMIQDRNHRPGVSISLQVEIVQAGFVGDRVRLISRCDKIGKSIAFISMEIRSSNGDLLARGKHIKYVKMGVFWDLLTGFLLFPFVLAILEYIVSSRKAKSAASCGNVAEFQSGHIFTVLNLEDIKDPVSFFSDDASTAGVTGAKKKKRKAAPIFEEGEACFSLRVNRSLSNVLGAMHGGAIAAAAEEASRRHGARASAKPTTQRSLGFVDTIEVTYLSPAKGELVVAVKEDQHALQRGRTVSEGRVLSRKTGQVCAEFKCSWAN